jgi:hypothetical protein
MRAVPPSSAQTCRGTPSEMRQFCKSCGHADRFDFWVTDAVWKAVVPPHFHTRVLCFACFDAFAARKGIDYRRDLHPTFWLVGETVSLELRALTLPLLAKALVAQLAVAGRAACVRQKTRRWPFRAVRAEVPSVGRVLPAKVRSRHSVLTPLSALVEARAFSGIVSAMRSTGALLNARTAVKGIVAQI